MKEEIKPGYTRVSDVSSAYANHHKIPKNILDYAADRGTQVHAIIDCIMNDIPVSEEMYRFSGKSIKGYVNSWEKFMSGTTWFDTVLYQEERLYNDELMITGKPDLVGSHPSQGKLIVDWKCTKAIGKHWELQAAGYSLLEPVTSVVFVRLCQDGGDPEVKQYNPDKELFIKAHELYKRYFEDKISNLEME